jgi:hypothetical protein
MLTKNNRKFQALLFLLLLLESETRARPQFPGPPAINNFQHSSSSSSSFDLRKQADLSFQSAPNQQAEQPLKRQ